MLKLDIQMFADVGAVVVKAEIDTKQFDAQIEDIKEKLEDVERLLSDTTGMDEDEIKKYSAEAEKLRNRLVDLNRKKEELSNQPTGLEEWSEGFGRSLERNIKKVGRLVLGIFGIRGAYMAVRSAMSIITNEDEQLKADIDYMKTALAYVLEPVVRRIVELFKTLMFYVGYIVKAWTGRNIFENANKGLKNATGSAKQLNKELHKTVASFDEMNVLQDTSSGGSSGGGGTTPSFDLSDFEDMPVPKWLEWLGKNGKDLIPILFGIAGGLTAIKLGLDPLLALGIGVTIWGIVGALQKGLDYIKDPSWEDFGEMIMYMGIATIGLGVAFGNLPAILIGVLIAMLGGVVKYWGEISDFVNKKLLDFEMRMKSVEAKFGGIIGVMALSLFETLKQIWTSIDNIFRGTRKQFDGFITFFKGVFLGDWNMSLDGMTMAFEGTMMKIRGIWDLTWGILKSGAQRIGNIIGTAITNALKDAVNGIMWLIENRINGAIDLINGVLSLINKIPGVNVSRVSRLNLPRLARGGIVNNPGQGVMMGNYIAGERGAEAVLPLTDDTLQRLANMIPITVNLTNTMNGRVISRELKKVQNEDNFAFNR